MSKEVHRAEQLAHTRPGWRAAAAVMRRRRWETPPREELGVGAFVLSLLDSISASQQVETPFRHWLLRRCLPEDAVNRILSLPFPAPRLGGISGRRELHNATRTYLDAESRRAFPVCEALCQAFQDERVTSTIAARFGARLAGTFLRVEFAQDTDGFWLEPHTDLGVKTFTMLLYVSQSPQHATLGTDLYDADKRHVGRSPFERNAALVFVPSDVTYHGFEQRRIEGVRKSVIVNYVTAEWRAREQLAFPDRPV